MQQHKIVEDYLKSVIPTNLTDNKKAELREEIESHIYDKANFYIEIGYDQNTAFEKAVNEMGKEEAELVKESFEVIYNDSTFKGKLLFFGLCIANLLPGMLGLSYVLLPDPTMPAHPTIADLFIFLCGFVLLTVYLVKCYRQSLYHQVVGITSAMGLISLCSWLYGGLFFPIINAGSLVFRFITNNLNQNDSIPYFANILFLALYMIMCVVSLDGPRIFKKKKYLLSIKTLSILLAIISLVFLVLYGFAYEKYERWYPLESKEEWYKETPKADYYSTITADQKHIYNSILSGEDIKTIETELFTKGFLKQETDYKEFIKDSFLLPFYASDYLSNQLTNNLESNQYSIYCYTNSMDVENDYDDIISCIIIAYDNNGEINYKLFIPDLNGSCYDRSYANYKHGNELKRWLNNLAIGDDAEKFLGLIRTTDASIIEDEKHDGENTTNTYQIHLQCHYELEMNFFDYIFRRYPRSVSYKYIFTLKVENSKITEGSMYDFATDEMLAVIN